MTLFGDSLHTLVHLLNRVGAEQWEASIRADIEAWETRRDSSQHQGKYGGHSSCSDWSFSSANGHRVDDVQATWANALLRELQLLLRPLAADPDDERLVRKVVNGLTRHPSVLHPYRHEPDNRRLKEPGSGTSLRVVCCPSCGARHTSRLDMEHSIARDVTAGILINALETGTASQMVDTLLDGGVEGLDDMRKKVRQAAAQNRIDLREDWNDDCMQCGEKNTVVEFWNLRGTDRLTLVPPSSSEAGRERAPQTTDAKPGKRKLMTARAWGVVVAVLAFTALVAELKYLAVFDTPDATGSLRGNYGTLVLLGLPLVFLVVGVLQAMSGISIREYHAVFNQKSLPRKICIAAVAVSTAIVAIGLATLF